MFSLNWHILIIDDEPLNSKLLQTWLHPEGYQTSSAINAEEALKLLNQKKPDLILLDIIMPGVNGYEFVEVLKAHAEWRNIPIILVTSLTDRNSYLIGLMVGASDVVTKPINSLELILKVKNLLQRLNTPILTSWINQRSIFPNT